MAYFKIVFSSSLANSGFVIEWCIADVLVALVYNGLPPDPSNFQFYFFNEIPVYTCSF
jgi:hypothetical protein